MLYCRHVVLNNGIADVTSVFCKAYFVMIGYLFCLPFGFNVFLVANTLACCVCLDELWLNVMNTFTFANHKGISGASDIKSSTARSDL